MVFKSDLLAKVPGLSHGFGTRDEPIPNGMMEEWKFSAPRWKQVHGVECAEVLVSHQDCGEVDALLTRKSGLPIAVVTADCVPILLARRSGGAIAAVHAGWRGTLARITRIVWQKLALLGEVPSEWVAAIGPAIGPCCYEVSEELAEEFSRKFDPSFGASLAVPRYRTLDLPAIHQADLLSMGFHQVDLMRACTRCAVDSEKPIFHSYRREGGGTRQFSMLLL